jgi:hypothetical protein
VGYLVFAYIIAAVVMGEITGRVWRSKGGKYWNGVCYGLFLGLLGILYVALVKPTYTVGPPTTGRVDKVCPRCAELVKRGAQVCRFCGHEFGPATPGRPPSPRPAS